MVRLANSQGFIPPWGGCRSLRRSVPSSANGTRRTTSASSTTHPSRPRCADRCDLRGCQAPIRREHRTGQRSTGAACGTRRPSAPTRDRSRASRRTDAGRAVRCATARRSAAVCASAVSLASRQILASPKKRGSSPWKHPLFQHNTEARLAAPALHPPDGATVALIGQRAILAQPYAAASGAARPLDHDRSQPAAAIGPLRLAHHRRLPPPRYAPFAPWSAVWRRARPGRRTGRAGVPSRR